MHVDDLKIVVSCPIKNDNEYERKTTLKEKLIFMNNFKK